MSAKGIQVGAKAMGRFQRYAGEACRRAYVLRRPRKLPPHWILGDPPLSKGAPIGSQVTPTWGKLPPTGSQVIPLSAKGVQVRARAMGRFQRYAGEAGCNAHLMLPPLNLPPLAILAHPPYPKIALAADRYPPPRASCPPQRPGCPA